MGLGVETHEPQHLVLVGPTASGKSHLALELADALGDIEVVSVDSMQVYRRMDIGTAKASHEDRRRVRHHMIDIAEPHEELALTKFADLASERLAEIEGRGKRALLVGGTGLYVQAIVDGLQPPGRYPDALAAVENESDTRALFTRLAGLDSIAAQRIEPGNRRRIVRALEVTLGSGKPFSSYGPGVNTFPSNDRFRMFGIWVPRDQNAVLIEQRVEAMFDAGWLEEVKALAADERSLSKTAAKALGYADLLAHLDGGVSLETAKESIKNRTRAFSRRQRMWFRRDPRITWLGCADDTTRLLPALKECCA